MLNGNSQKYPAGATWLADIFLFLTTPQITDFIKQNFTWDIDSDWVVTKYPQMKPVSLVSLVWDIKFSSLTKTVVVIIAFEF